MKNIKNRPLLYVIPMLIGILVLLAIQGFDVVDEGWYLSFYQQFFNHPESVEYNFVFYFTGLLGGLWYKLFPSGGIVAFRMLAALVIILIFYCSYAILKQYISKGMAIAGLLMVIFVNDFGYLSFYYNHLSSLFAVLTVLCLMRALTNSDKRFFVLAGILTAVNVFVRLPNLTLIGLAVVIPIFNYRHGSKNSRGLILRHTMSYTIGLAIGLIFSYTIILSLGHWDIFSKSLEGILIKGQAEGSNHNIKALVSVYFSNYILVAKQGLKLLVLIGVLTVLKARWARYRLTEVFCYVIGIIGFVYVFHYKAIYGIYALNIILCGVFLFSKRKSDRPFESLVVLATLLMLLLPIGSDGGLNNVGYMSIWLLLPISMYWLRSGLVGEVLARCDVISKNHGSSVLGIAMALLIGYSLTRIEKVANNAYFDPGSRLEKTHVINAPLAAGIHTTKRRAEIINNVLAVLDTLVEKDAYLLAYDKVPMLNFLTETKPYMYNSWVWVYDGQTFQSQLKRAQKDIPEFPVVVQQKFETIVDFSEPDANYMSEVKPNSYYYNAQRVIAMNRFLNENEYHLLWSNDYFNIFSTSRTGPSK